VCQLARKHVTVALSGDGGDEGFAGYRRYRLHMMEEGLRSALPLGLRRPLFGALGRIYPKADWAPRFVRAKTTFQSLARNSLEAYFHPRMLACALGLWAVACYLRGRGTLALALVAVAFLMHPTTAIWFVKIYNATEVLRGGQWLETWDVRIGRALAMGLAVGLAQHVKYNGWLAGAIVALAAAISFVAALVTFGAAQLARRMGVPFRSGGGLCGSKIPDAQAAYESANTLWSTILSGRERP
jgi:hypothetical protein